MFHCICMYVMSGLRLSDLNKETTYLLPYSHFTYYFALFVFEHLLSAFLRVMSLSLSTIVRCALFFFFHVPCVRFQ